MTSNYRETIALSFLGKKGSFDSYFTLYDTLLERSGNHVVHVDSPESWSPISHSDILLVSDELKSHPEWTLETAKQILKLRFPIPRADQEVDFAINVSVQAMLMVDTRAGEAHSPSFRIGKYRPTSWHCEETLAEFLSRSFQTARDASEDKIADALEDKSCMKAWKLKRRLGITFRRTDNLAWHLLFDQRHNILYLFCHASFLKAHLERAARGSVAKDCSIADSLKIGSLPPRLLAETLHSIQSLFFPFADSRSQGILNELIIGPTGFDPACALHEGYKMFEDSANDFTYRYWGERLSILHEVVVNRPPKNRIERWIRWQTSEANAFIVALAALFISIIIGILSLGLSAFQAWISWQQWKNPTPEDRKLGQR